MNSRQFHQAGMKKCQARKDEMQCRRQYRSSGILLWHSENFTIIAKFPYGQIFAMIEKFRYIAKINMHSKIQIFAMPAIFAMIAKFLYIAKVTVHSENSNFRNV